MRDRKVLGVLCWVVVRKIYILDLGPENLAGFQITLDICFLYHGQLNLYFTEFWPLSVDLSILLWQLTSKALSSPVQILEEVNLTYSAKCFQLLSTALWDAASRGMRSPWVRFQSLIQSIARPLDQQLWLPFQALIRLRKPV